MIDDDASCARTLGETLAEEGIEVDGLANSEDAPVLLSAGEMPDVLVADIDLGAGVSGLDLASIAQERHRADGMVLTSGTPPNADVLKRRERFLCEHFAQAVGAPRPPGPAKVPGRWTGGVNAGEGRGGPSPGPACLSSAPVPRSSFAPEKPRAAASLAGLSRNT